MNYKLAIDGGTPVRDKSFEWKNTIGYEERKQVLEVLDSGRLSVFRGGPKVTEFEKTFAANCGVQYGIATTSGTTALHTAVSALGIGPGDEVLVPALTFVSTASVVLQQGAKPVFVDIDPDTYCMSPEDLFSKITKNSRAVIPVHIFGHVADMDYINDISKNAYSIFVIEDAAQAQGAMYKDQPAGSLGDCGCFSFFQTKNMTCGEGGMVVTNHDWLDHKARLKREHGSPKNPDTWYIYDELGFNYAMTEMQAAVGLGQFSKLEGFNTARKENAAYYTAMLKHSKLVLPETSFGVDHVFHNYPVLLPKGSENIRDKFVKAVQAENVPMDICYPSPLYKAKVFNGFNKDVRCPITESVTQRIMTLFTDPVLERQDLDQICEAVLKVEKQYLR